MAYNPHKHGRADYGSYMQLTNAQAAITEGSDSLPLTAQKFANLVYQVNPTPISISGGISIGDVTIKDQDGHYLQISPSGQMQVEDSALTKALTSETQAIIDVLASKYSQIVKVDGEYTYIMKAFPSSGGITSGAAVWQVYRVHEDNAGNFEVMYADGDHNFDNIAANYLTLTYSF